MTATDEVAQDERCYFGCGLEGPVHKLLYIPPPFNRIPMLCLGHSRLWRTFRQSLKRDVKWPADFWAFVTGEPQMPNFWEVTDGDEMPSHTPNEVVGEVPPKCAVGCGDASIVIIDGKRGLCGRHAEGWVSLNQPDAFDLFLAGHHGPSVLVSACIPDQWYIVPSGEVEQFKGLWEDQGYFLAEGAAETSPGRVLGLEVRVLPAVEAEVPQLRVPGRARRRQGDTFWLYEADVMAILKDWPENSIDAVITDPPYEINFMAKKWDRTGIAFKPETWAAVLRVLKPGGHLLSFGGPRTSHRIACAIEDAGFEVRDTLSWLYGTGFPKSLNLGDGRGTALKPAWEPVILARKPLVGTVAANVQVWGTGAINVDGCRIATADGKSLFRGRGQNVMHDGYRRPYMDDAEHAAIVELERKARCAETAALGRWPANVVLDEEAAAALDAQTGTLISGRVTKEYSATLASSVALGAKRRMLNPTSVYSDSGGASRFFYVAKASRAERDVGCESLPARTGGEATDREEGSAGLDSPRAGAGRTGGSRNFHPTVKPIAFMRWLTRLVARPGAVVLDPFMGSGSTGIAAILEHCRFVGVDMTPEYLPIAQARITWALENEEEP